MLPLRFFRSRAFSAANVVSLLMYFGMFGSIFLLAQFFQVVQGYSPFQAGLRTLPWTGMPIIVAPIAGVARRPDRRPADPRRPGMALQAVALGWLAVVVTPDRPVRAHDRARSSSPAIGMGLFFAPIANVVLSAVRPEEEGKASGANNTIREVGGVFGVAVLASVFSGERRATRRRPRTSPGCSRRSRSARRGRGRRPRGAVHPGPRRGADAARRPDGQVAASTAEPRSPTPSPR